MLQISSEAIGHGNKQGYPWIVKFRCLRGLLFRHITNDRHTHARNFNLLSGQMPSYEGRVKINVSRQEY